MTLVEFSEIEPEHHEHQHDLDGSYFGSSIGNVFSFYLKNDSVFPSLIGKRFFFVVHYLD